MTRRYVMDHSVVLFLLYKQVVGLDCRTTQKGTSKWCLRCSVSYSHGESASAHDCMSATLIINPSPQKGQFLRNRWCIQDTPVNSRRWWTYPYQSWCKSCKDLCGYRWDRWEAVLLSLVFRPSTFHTPCGCKSCSQSKRNTKHYHLLLYKIQFEFFFSDERKA